MGKTAFTVASKFDSKADMNDLCSKTLQRTRHYSSALRYERRGHYFFNTSSLRPSQHSINAQCALLKMTIKFQFEAKANHLSFGVCLLLSLLLQK